MGLDPSKHLGKELSSLDCYLHKLKEYVISFQAFWLSSFRFSHYKIILWTNLAGCMELTFVEKEENTKH